MTDEQARQESCLNMLLNQAREALRRTQYARRTQETYLAWISRYLRFYHCRHPQEMGMQEIKAFLISLAVDQHVAASTQNQALSALLFFYREVLKYEFPEEFHGMWAKLPQRLPIVLSKGDVRKVLAQLSGTHELMAKLLYGSGLRLMECVRLRVKDLDFAQKLITVRDERGLEDRVTILPESLVKPLRHHLKEVKRLHKQDLERGYGRVYLPVAIAQQHPKADMKWNWQYVFPSRKHSVDPDSGLIRRQHLDESGLQKAVRKAARQAEILQPVSCQTFRHSFATHLLEAGYDIRTVQELLGHKDVTRTMVYLHVLLRKRNRVVSPVDR